MKAWIIAILMLALVAPALAENDTQEVIVVFEEEPEGIMKLFSNNAAEVAQVKSELQNKTEFKNIKAVAAEVTGEELKELQKKKGVKEIIPEFRVQTVLQESTSIIGSDAIRANFSLNETGKSVCVIDSGLDLNNSYFLDNFVGGHKFIGTDRVNCSENITACQDDNGHGTHVSGIIKGVNPNAGLVVVKTLDAQGTGGTIDLLRGIDFCIDNAQTMNISVISMSLGGSCSDGLCYTNYCNPYHSDFEQAFQAANDKNISVVVSTGNEMQTNKVSFPSCVEEAVRVGSSSKSDTMSWFTNRWGADMILAPGQSINSTWLSGGYQSLSGTSMAAPHISAGLLLLADYYNTSNRTFLENNLYESEIQIFDSGSGLNYTRMDLQSSILNGNYTPNNQSNTSINESQSDLQNVTIVPEEPEPQAPSSGGGGGGPSWDDFNEANDRAGEDLPVGINTIETPEPENKGTLLSLIANDPLDVKAWSTELWNKIKGWFIQ